MIVAGFGFRKAARTASLRDALQQACGAYSPDALVTAEAKADSPAIEQLAAELGLPLRAIPPDALSAQATETQSDPSHTAHNTGSVAEAAALAAAGPGARLIRPRAVSTDRMATCALATREET